MEARLDLQVQVRHLIGLAMLLKVAQRRVLPAKPGAQANLPVRLDKPPGLTLPKRQERPAIAQLKLLSVETPIQHHEVPTGRSPHENQVRAMANALHRHKLHVLNRRASKTPTIRFG